jgi:hypothetical protein
MILFCTIMNKRKDNQIWLDEIEDNKEDKQQDYHCFIVRIKWDSVFYCWSFPAARYENTQRTE